MGANALMYFAYGSNMLSTRLQAVSRCPTARVVGVAELPGYALKWHKASKDGSAKCDVTQVDGAKVYGVLYAISADEKPALDSAEGLGYGYEQTVINAHTNEGVVQAITYVATKTSPTLKPYSWYRALVLAGAREHGLPADYIAQMEQVEIELDSDSLRHCEQMQIVEGVVL